MCFSFDNFDVTLGDEFKVDLTERDEVVSLPKFVVRDLQNNNFAFEKREKIR